MGKLDNISVINKDLYGWTVTFPSYTEKGTRYLNKSFGDDELDKAYRYGFQQSTLYIIARLEAWRTLANYNIRFVIYDNKAACERLRPVLKKINDELLPQLRRYNIPPEEAAEIVDQISVEFLRIKPRVDANSYPKWFAMTFLLDNYVAGYNTQSTTA